LIFGQRPKRQKHVGAGSVTFAKANHLVECCVFSVRRSDNAMKRNAEIGLITKPSKFSRSGDDVAASQPPREKFPHGTSDAAHFPAFQADPAGPRGPGLGIAAAVYFGSRHLATVPEQIAAPARSAGGMLIDGVHQSAARDGRTEWILDARSATYFSDGKMFQLSEPNVTFFRADGQKFFLTARRGTVLTDSHDMDASEDVVIWNDTHRLETESIRYRYADRLIESQRPVKVTTHTGELTADALSANLTTNRMAFSGHVQGLLLAAPTPAAGAPAGLAAAGRDRQGPRPIRASRRGHEYKRGRIQRARALGREGLGDHF
jgi:LPS export ABC transporter protein LptC